MGQFAPVWLVVTAFAVSGAVSFVVIWRDALAVARAGEAVRRTGVESDYVNPRSTMHVTGVFGVLGLVAGVYLVQAHAMAEGWLLLPMLSLGTCLVDSVRALRA